MNPGDVPAFPNDHPGTKTMEGMSLRDYFAGQVLVGLASRVALDGRSIAEGVLAEAAQHAYAIADKMLEARGR